MRCRTVRACSTASWLQAAARGGLPFDDLLEQGSEEWERPTGEAAPTSKDIMLIYFTSGTTGMAKAVEHNFAHPLGHILTARYCSRSKRNKLHMSVTDSGWAKFGWGKIYGTVERCVHHLLL